MPRRGNGRVAGRVLATGTAGHVCRLPDLVMNVPEKGQEDARGRAKAEYEVAQLASEYALRAGGQWHEGGCRPGEGGVKLQAGSQSRSPRLRRVDLAIDGRSDPLPRGARPRVHLAGAADPMEIVT